MHQRSWLALLSLPLVGTFSVPVFIQNSPSPRSAPAPVAAQDPLAGMADIQDVLGYVRDSYVDAPDMGKVVGGGIQGVLERAHPLNALLSPEDLRLPDPGPADIGITVVKRVIYAQVVSVRPEGPGAKAGFQPGDLIRKIDGESVGPLSSWTLERRLRGSEGSEITLLRYSSGETQASKVTLRRALPGALAVGLRRTEKAQVLTLPDLSTGRASELAPLLAGLDRALPLLVDLRSAAGGTLDEAARVMGLLVKEGPLGTVQEHGGKEQALAATPSGSVPFGKVVVLLGPGTAGAPEALASGLRKAGCLSVGERSAGMGVERTRIPLRQGGAVELVTRRWVGAGGEKLDRQGVNPDQALRGLKADEDPLPKVLPLLDAKKEGAEEGSARPPRKVARALHLDPGPGEVA